MDTAMLSFVLSHLPDEWEDIPVYKKSFYLFTLSISKNAREYQKVETYFDDIAVIQIKRVQNPFHYGRFMLRHEMVDSNYEGIVFHGVHRDDMDIALKFNCDYRRYQKRYEGFYEDGLHPKFYHSISNLLNEIKLPLTDLRVLVLKILTDVPQTQCDYYISYMVKL